MQPEFAYPSTIHARVHDSAIDRVSRFFRLANGWRLARHRHMNAEHLEIEGPTDRDLAALRRAGCTTEIVAWRKGRGGTDFRPGFEWLEERDVRPGVCLYLTDMECSSYPATEPDFGVVWCNCGPPPRDWYREPWGERIDIPEG